MTKALIHGSSVATTLARRLLLLLLLSGIGLAVGAAPSQLPGSPSQLIQFAGFQLSIVPDSPDRIPGTGAGALVSMEYTGGSLPERPAPGPVVYSFRAEFRLDKSLSAHRLALYTGISEYPYTVFLNGSELATRGRHGNQYNSSLRAALSVYMPPSQLRFGETPNDLVIEAYPEYETWGLEFPYVGPADDIAWAVFWRNFFGINLVQASFIMSLVMIVYVLALYFLGSNRRRADLYFVALGLAYCLAYVNVVIHNEALPEVPLEALSKAGMVLSSTFLVAFVVEFTGLFAGTWHKKLFLGVTLAAGAIAAGLILVQRDKQSILAMFSLGMNMLILPELLVNAAVLVWALLRKGLTLVLPLMAAIVIVILTAAHDIVYLNSSTLPFIWLTPYGYFAYVLAIYAILALEQGTLYRTSLRQTQELIESQHRIEQLNQELMLQRDSFFRFVPTQFLQLLGKDSALQIQLGDSSLRYLSVLFADIRHYTGISEDMLPDQILRFLNEYLFRMERAIQKNNGFVDKYIGDAILALFHYEGQSSSGQSMSADIALKAASEMDQLLNDYNLYARASGNPNIEIGIGVNTGEVVLGTVGSEYRLDTTVIGDTVNVSSRLESLTKHYGVRFLVSETTKDALMCPEQFTFRQVDHISVAGRLGGLRIFELLNPESDYGKRVMEASAEYERGHALTRERRFDEASFLFDKLASANQEDRVVALHCKRTREYAISPPADDWDGVFHFASK